MAIQKSMADISAAPMAIDDRQEAISQMEPMRVSDEERLRPPLGWKTPAMLIHD